MPELTKQDKISILRRLIKRVESWRFNKSIPMLLIFGSNDFGPNSPAFQEWLRDVNDGIKVVFGEYSHYVADVNDIRYSEVLSALLGNSKEQKANFWKGLETATTLLQQMIEEVKESGKEAAASPAETRQSAVASKQCVFIGHGRSPLWLTLRRVLQESWALEIVCFESEPRSSQSIVPILKEMLDRASFAVIVLTAEDVTATGELRGRQNVIHEAGLAQGKLGFEKVVILKQEGVEEPSNLAGLQYISFQENKIEKAFYELQEVLKRERLIL